MAKLAKPVLSIIVRRFQFEQKEEIMLSLGQLQKAAGEYPGYLGDQNSLVEDDDNYELVNVFAFNSRENLKKWEESEQRRSLLADLDRHPQSFTRHENLDEITQLLHPTSSVSKFEIVLILIFWILVAGAALGMIADLILPTTFPPMWRSVFLVSVNVILISYFLLPWSSSLLGKMKAKVFGPKSSY
ncbi:hypothetical protein [Aliiroseovarius sp. F47248L]|uniref:hypothetical protein n=1 Tax=Aliiroseovarius sp. F47248L TaxID=2926420 RepID=UPI001FF67733|nr:hypothetical protein [Aliiroseovarius sp. F47248L]MCK0137477.1 hypothetical protein [Aliiroseovarius sp. F47248L]